MPEECPHRNATITGGGPYYRQVHPNNFQEGRVLSPASVLQDTGCHLTLPLNDGARTIAERCHREFTARGGRLSAAVVSISTDELAEIGRRSGGGLTQRTDPRLKGRWPIHHQLGKQLSDLPEKSP